MGPPQDESKKNSTELRIEVTGGDDAVPVKSATVYIEWTEGEEIKRREGTTDARGIAGPYMLPMVKILVQITTGDDAWVTYGAEHELTQEQQTLRIRLTRKQTSLGVPDWPEASVLIGCVPRMPPSTPLHPDGGTLALDGERNDPPRRQ